MTLSETIHTLVQRAQRGDREAFGGLVERYRDRLKTVIDVRLAPWLRRRVGMEDLLQETLTRALDCLGRFRWQGPESFRLWLQGIAENVVREAVKRHRRDAWLEILPEVPAVTVSPSRHLRREERWSRLKTALDGLSEDHRTVLVLARLEGLKLDEIAERMHRSPSAVKSLLFRAMGELRRSFGDTESLHLTDRSLEERGGGDVEA